MLRGVGGMSLRAYRSRGNREGEGRASYLFRSHGHHDRRPRSQRGSVQQKGVRDDRAQGQGHDGGGEDDLHGGLRKGIWKMQQHVGLKRPGRALCWVCGWGGRMEEMSMALGSRVKGSS